MSPQEVDEILRTELRRTQMERDEAMQEVRRCCGVLPVEHFHRGRKEGVGSLLYSNSFALALVASREVEIGGQRIDKHYSVCHAVTVALAAERCAS